MVPVLKSHILKDVTHGFFTRQGGVSIGNYASLNCSLKEDTLENVQENRHRALEALSLEKFPLCLLKQVHGSTVHFVDDHWDFNKTLEGDALVTNRYDVVLGVQTADCMPILLADTKNELIGVIHAGWRGVVAGVIEKTIEMMRAHGSTGKNIVAAIGPCIAMKNYVVGDDFYEAFLEYDILSQIFFAYNDMAGGTRHFDLPAFAMKILKEKEVRVEQLPYDTYASEDLFFSCRRAQHEGATSFGGQLSAIALPLRKLMG
jgi:YfiH family protein